MRQKLAFSRQTSLTQTHTWVSCVPRSRIAAFLGSTIPQLTLLGETQSDTEIRSRHHATSSAEVLQTEYGGEKL